MLLLCEMWLKKLIFPFRLTSWCNLKWKFWQNETRQLSLQKLISGLQCTHGHINTVRLTSNKIPLAAVNTPFPSHFLLSNAV